MNLKRYRGFLWGLLALFAVACGNSDGEAPTFQKKTSSVTFSCDQLDDNSSSGVGVNLTALDSDGDSHWRFIDAFTKASATWIADSPSLGWDQGSITAFDDAGWPTQVTGDTRPTVQMFVNIGGNYPAGTYVLHWEGAGGTFAVSGDADSIACADGAAISDCPSQTAYVTVNSTSDQGITLAIVPDDADTYATTNYLYNLILIMPGGTCGTSKRAIENFTYCQTSRGGEGSCDAGYTCFDFDEVYWDRFNDAYSKIDNPKIAFHPQSMKRMQGLRSLRFAEMMRMEETSVTDWSTRTTRTDFSWAGTNGPPPEITVWMANHLAADPWINIPYQASDDYVAGLAAYYATNLDDSLTVYVEHSSEPWQPDTSNYPQAAYFLAQADSLGIDSTLSSYLRQGMAYAQRAAEVFALWDASFTDSTRRKRVLATWARRSDLVAAMLDQSGVASSVDALAMAPTLGAYLAHDSSAELVQAWTLDTVFLEINSGVMGLDAAPDGALAQAKTQIDEHLALAQTYGLILVSFDAGSRLWSYDAESNSKLVSLFKRANQDSRIGVANLELYTYWKDSGAYLLTAGPWMAPHGANSRAFLPNENATCADYPNLGGLNSFMTDYTCWWGSCGR